MKFKGFLKISDYIESKVEKEITKTFIFNKIAQAVDPKKIAEMQRELIYLSNAVKNNKKYSNMAAALSMAPYGADQNYGNATTKAINAAKQIADDLNTSGYKLSISLYRDINSINQNIANIKNMLTIIKNLSAPSTESKSQKNEKKLLWEKGYKSFISKDYTGAIEAYSELIDILEKDTSYAQGAKDELIKSITYNLARSLSFRNQGADQESAIDLFKSLLNTNFASAAKEELSRIENISKTKAVV